MRLANKVAIITGAGSGIGKASALPLACKGAAVVAGVRQAKDIAPLEQEAAGLPGCLVGGIFADRVLVRRTGGTRYGHRAYRL